MSKDDQPAVGIPYPYATNPQSPMQQMHSYPTEQQQQQQKFYYVGQNPYQAGMVPPNAIYGDPKGIPLQQTMFRDTPAPFNCVHCGSSGITDVNKVFMLDGPDFPMAEPCWMVESSNLRRRKSISFSLQLFRSGGPVSDGLMYGDLVDRTMLPFPLMHLPPLNLDSRQF